MAPPSDARKLECFLKYRSPPDRRGGLSRRVNRVLVLDMMEPQCRLYFLERTNEMPERINATNGTLRIKPEAQT
jgi:hypothetical protein